MSTFYRHTYSTRLGISFLASSVVQAHTAHTYQTMQTATIRITVLLYLYSIVYCHEEIVFPGSTNAEIPIAAGFANHDHFNEIRLPRPSDGCGQFKSHPRLKIIYLARTGNGEYSQLYYYQCKIVKTNFMQDLCPLSFSWVTLIRPPEFFSGYARVL